MKPRLIAIDLDGTLVGKNLQVSDRVRDAIARARAQGVHVSIVTGRMFAAARPFAQLLELRGPVVCYQGAAIYASASGERIAHTPVPDDLALEVVAQAKRDGVHVQCYFDDMLYLEQLNRFSKMYTDLAQVDPVVVPSLEDELRRGRESTKIVMVLDASDADAYMVATRDRLGRRGYVTRSNPDFVEVVDPRVDKGAALRFIAERDGVPLDATMAIGDSWNDVPLVQAAAFGVAMGSAPPELRAVAKAVVADVEQDGVAEAVERYVLP